MSQEVTRIIGWSLIHFIWQGAVIALLLQGVMIAGRSATSRYRWLMAGMLLMLAAPFATAWVLSRPAVQLPPMDAALFIPTGSTAPAVQGAAPVAQGIHFSIAWLVYAWLTGVVGLSLRWLGGWVWLERMRRQAEPLSQELTLRCRHLMRHIGLQRSVEFAQSALLAVPVVVGWLRPVVLIPLSTLTSLSPQQLDSVILHELAHVRRLDAFANLFQILVETLLFYHPAVWWLSHRIRIEREHCCDDIAVSIGGNNFGYAMALTLLEAERAYPQMAMAATGGALKNRVKRLLGHEAAPSRPFHLAALAVALIGMLLGGTTLQAMASVPHAAPPAPVAAMTPPAPAEAPSALRVSSPTQTGSFIGSMADAGYKDLTSSELITLKNVGVTGEEAAAWRANGFKPDTSELVTLHTMGIRPTDAAGFRDAGLTDLPIHDLGTLKSVGVSPDYVRQMRKAGFNTTTASDFVTARSVGVTPDFVAMLASRGVDLTPSRIITLKASGLN
jgi:beta-lactamase regulating signal transducer with metallopeptidase domain